MPADFDTERYLAGASGILRGDLVTVRVVFAPELARYIREHVSVAGAARVARWTVEMMLHRRP